MITLRAYSNPAEAALAKSLLDDHNILCSLADENAYLYGGAPLAMPVRIVVADEQAEEAGRVLKNADRSFTGFDSSPDSGVHETIRDRWSRKTPRRGATTSSTIARNEQSLGDFSNRSVVIVTWYRSIAAETRFNPGCLVGRQNQGNGHYHFCARHGACVGSIGGCGGVLAHHSLFLPLGRDQARPDCSRSVARSVDVTSPPYLVKNGTTSFLKLHYASHWDHGWDIHR